MYLIGVIATFFVPVSNVVSVYDTIAVKLQRRIDQVFRTVKSISRLVKSIVRYSHNAKNK